MISIGNRNVNSLLEYRVPRRKKPTADSKYEDKVAYIKNKYVSRLYAVSFSENFSNKECLECNDRGECDSFNDCAYATHFSDVASQKAKMMVKYIFEKDIIGTLMMVMMDADVNQLENCDESPLIIAICSEYCDPVMKLLLTSNVNFARVYSNNSFTWSSKGRRYSEVSTRLIICELLAQNGAHCDLPCSVNRIYGTFCSHAKLIFDYFYPKDETGSSVSLTPLHVAVALMDLEAIIYLMKKQRGALGKTDSLGRTAVELLDSIDVSLFESFNIPVIDLELLREVCRCTLTGCTSSNYEPVDMSVIKEQS